MQGCIRENALLHPVRARRPYEESFAQSKKRPRTCNSYIGVLHRLFLRVGFLILGLEKVRAWYHGRAGKTRMTLRGPHGLLGSSFNNDTLRSAWTARRLLLSLMTLTGTNYSFVFFE